jgi:WD40 repeat protein
MRNSLVSLSILVSLAFPAVASRAANDDLGFPLPPGTTARLGTQSMRQAGGVNALLFTGGDARLLAAGTSGAIHSWDPDTGKLMGRFGVNSRSIVSLTKTPDEQTFFATSVDDFIARFRRGDLERPEEMRTPGVSPVVSPALDRICVVADDLINFNLLDIEGKMVKPVESKGMRPIEAVFSDDGSLLAISSLTVPDGKSKAKKQPVLRIVKVHAEAGADEVKTLTLQDGLFFKRVRFLPDNRRIVAAGIDGVIRIVDIENSVVEPTAKFGVESASSMALSADASLVAVGDAAGAVSVFTIEGLTLIQNVTAHLSPVTAVAFSSDGTRVATGGSDSTIRVFEVATGEVLCGPRGHDAPLSCAAASADGSKVVTGTYSGQLFGWDPVSGEQRFRVKSNDGSVNRIAITRAGDTIVTGGQNGEIAVFDAATGAERKRIGASPAAVMDFALSADGRKAFAIYADNRLRCIDLTTGESTLDVEYPSQSLLFSIAATDDGSRLAIGASAIRILDAKGEKILDIDDVRVPVLSLTFVANGAELAAGLADGSIRIYDVATGKESRRVTFGDGSGRVRRVMVSGDGAELIACSESDPVARAYAVKTLEKIRDFAGHSEPVFDVAYRGEGGVVTASADTTALVWKR